MGPLHTDPKDGHENRCFQQDRMDCTEEVEETITAEKVVEDQAILHVQNPSRPTSSLTRPKRLEQVNGLSVEEIEARIEASIIVDQNAMGNTLMHVTSHPQENVLMVDETEKEKQLGKADQLQLDAERWDNLFPETAENGPGTICQPVQGKGSTLRRRRRSFTEIKVEEIMLQNSVVNTQSRPPVKPGSMMNGQDHTDGQGQDQDVDAETIFNAPEVQVLKIINSAIDKGFNFSSVKRVSGLKTVLHLAAEKNYLEVAEKLLEDGCNPLDYYIKAKADGSKTDEEKITPLHLAIEKKHDHMAALIIRKMDSDVVRRLFGESEVKVQVSRRNSLESNYYGNSLESPPEENCFDESEVLDLFNMKDLISRDLDETILAVLDKLVVKKQKEKVEIHVKLLEVDNKGREPQDENYDYTDETVFHCLCRNVKKEAIHHEVMQALIKYKWKKWCRQRFATYTCLYLISLFSLTFAAVNGAYAEKVTKYKSTLDYFRAIFEVVSFIYALVVFLTEIRQFIRHRLHYFEEFCNWVEFSAACLIILVLPLRYGDVKGQWIVFAVGYLLWVSRIYKYAAVFSQTGMYVESLKRIAIEDFLAFSVFFCVINLAFAGTFALMLRAEDSLETAKATSTYWGILFVGLRTMIEAGNVVDEFTDYKVLSTIVMMVFMVVTMVVLLNILIAQISNTYQNAQDDAYLMTMANRGWIIARSERNEWRILTGKHRKNRCFYYEAILVQDLKSATKYRTQLDDIESKLAEMKKTQMNDGLELQKVKIYADDTKTSVDSLTEEIKQMKELLMLMSTTNGSNKFGSLQR